MIKLDSLDSGGKQIIYRYDISDATWDYGSFENIVTDSAAPPSKIFPTNNATAGGIYDHAFVLTFFSTGSPSSATLGVGTGGDFWDNINDFVADLAGALTVDKVYVALTEMEYVAYFDPSGKQFCHIGFDVYVKP